MALYSVRVAFFVACTVCSLKIVESKYLCSITSFPNFAGIPIMSELLDFECADKRKINIPEEVGIKFTQFGAILLPQDQSGARVKNMAYKHSNDPERINTEILREWLTGNGKQPVTWSTLVEVLRDIGLSALADDISNVQCPPSEQK